MKWNDILPEEVRRLAVRLAKRAEEERVAGKQIFPPQNCIFQALEATPPDRVKAVIVGQDPYHGPGQANGLAFSVGPGIVPPPSLRNIFKELHADLGHPIPQSGDLSSWAGQGVLLLNTVLTVEQGKPNSHKDWGWQDFTLAVFRACAGLPQPIVFILWGGQARAFTAGLQVSSKPNKACIWSSHPSPLGATKGGPGVSAFVGSRPFSTANGLLRSMGTEEVDWRL